VWKDCSKVAQSSSTATPDDLHQRKSIPLKFLACSLEEDDVSEEGGCRADGSRDFGKG
jgi:hypothetical protein